MSFGDRLRDERVAAGLSVRGLASLAGISHVTLLRYESGEYREANEGALALADALGLGIVDLIDEGPPLFEVAVEADDEAAGIAAARGLPPGLLGPRVSPWPWVGDGVMRLRVRVSAVPIVIAHLGPCSVQPVAASSSLSVYVQGRHRGEAIAAVLHETTRAQCCPPVEVRRSGPLWLARLREVPERCSVVLQRLAPAAPVGLFVPIHI